METPGSDLSLDLVERIRDGDATAFESLYRRYRDPLLFSIRCRLGKGLRARLESEDILHSVVKDALFDLRTFEPRAGATSLAHYLHVCVLNKIRAKADHFGAAKRSGDVPLTDSIADGLAGGAGASDLGYADSERYEKLEKALARLPEEQREAILLRRVEGLSNAEAAVVLGKSPEAASKLYNRAIARLGIEMGAG